MHLFYAWISALKEFKNVAHDHNQINMKILFEKFLIIATKFLVASNRTSQKAWKTIHIKPFIHNRVFKHSRTITQKNPVQSR